jgi:oxygen-independent coproporphyrinogen-3 oxidase
MATATLKLPERWQDAVMKEGQAFADFVEVSDGEAAREHLLMNLRLAEGIDLAAYEMRWGMRPALEKITPLAGHGLLNMSGDILRTTPQGRLVLNAVIAALLN